MWVVLTLFFAANLTAQDRNCGTMDVLDRQIKEDPMIQKNMEEIERQTKEYLRKYPNGSGQRAVITIPVVVHVVYNSSVPAQNISDAQIQSQIDVLNQDFSATNADLNLVPSFFQPAIGNIEVQFCLAVQDPNGNSTPGITRKSSAVTNWFTNDNVKKLSAGGVNPWNPAHYLNIWVCSIGNGILGYAQFPGGSSATDGVVIDYRYFGTIGITGQYNKGRTATHEVGHWLNLRHIWGDENCGDDLVSDTPTHNTANYYCYAYPHNSTCSGNPAEMTMNYMDYTPDACMQMFSKGQKTRMRAVLEGAGSRASLAGSPGCMPPNPNACNPPAGLATSNINTTSATSSWSAANNAVTYTFEYKASSASTWIYQTVAGTSVNLAGLSASTVYNTRVLTNCSLSSSGYSATVNFTTAAPPPPCNDAYEANNTSGKAKSIVINSTSGIGSLNAKINVSSDLDWFKFKNLSAKRNIKVDLINLTANYDVKLFRKGNLNTPVGLSQNAGTASEQIIFNNTLSATDYYVQVYGTGGAFDNNNCYNLSVTISGSTFRTDGSEIEEDLIPVQDEFLVFPNPATDEITLVVPFGKQTEGLLSVVDITGKVVSSQKLSGDRTLKTFTMDVSQFKSGLYMINFTSGEKSYTQKLAVTDKR